MNIEVVSKKPTQKSDHRHILFVHGAWHGAWCWKRFQTFFSERGFETHAMSLRGHGNSEGRDRLRWYRSSDYVADVVKTVKQMPSPPVLVGHSLGGYLILKFLEQHSVPGAVLLAPVPARGSLKMGIRVLLRHPWQVTKFQLTLDPYALIESPQLARDAFFSQDMPDDLLNHYFPLLQGESFMIGLDTTWFDRPRPEMAAPTPMLVLGAANDVFCSRKEVEATARAYESRAEFFPDMAHDMMLEENWEKVAGRIQEWLLEKGF